MTVSTEPRRAPAPAPKPPSPARRTFAFVNAAAGLLLMVAGGMVTSTASGLAVPDWPLSYGRWLPAMTGGVFYEHGHRMFAAGVGALILIMAVWTQFADSRPGVRRLGWWTLALVCGQGVLGGVTVFMGLPALVSAAHATLGQTIFCLLVVMAEFVSSPGPVARAPGARALRALAVAAVAALWIQLLAGAIMRHGGAGLSWHLSWAFVAATTAGAFAAAVYLRGDWPAPLAQGARALLALLGAQILLGVATADFRTLPAPRANPVMIAVATAHLAVGAALLASAVLLCVRVWRADEP